MIYLPSERAQQNLAESKISQNERVVTITATSAPRLLRNAIHAAAATQDADSAQVIDLAQVLAVQRVSRRILVAEDNATNRTIIAQLLENAGHKVIIAEDGEEALDIFERDAPDLAILDFNMPLRNGIDVTKAIRTMEATGEHLPIVVMSASVTPETRDRARRAGADEFLGKPYEAAALLQGIDRLARRASRAASLPRTQDTVGKPTAITSPLLDQKRFNEVANLTGDPDFVPRLVDGFRVDVERLLSKLDSAVETKSLQDIADITHGIKGAALGVGATRMAAKCDAVDTAAARGRIDNLQAQCGEIRKTFAETLSELYTQSARKFQASV